MNVTRSPKIALLGESGAGKTHFITQLYLRLSAGRAEGARLQGTPAATRVVQETAERLVMGLSGERTTSGVYDELPLALDVPGIGPIELSVPDYAGEQVKWMLAYRRVEPAWRTRIRAADGWLFLLRPRRFRTPDDILSRPAGSLRSADSPVADANGWCGPAEVVELLQILLHTAGADVGVRTAPPTVFLLSCWDEIREAGVPPGAMLRERLPLVSDFIETNWKEGSCQILGLSSLGRALDEKKADAEFKEKGPDLAGYIVLPDGNESDDLTIPVRWLLDGKLEL